MGRLGKRDKRQRNVLSSLREDFRITLGTLSPGTVGAVSYPTHRSNWVDNTSEALLLYLHYTISCQESLKCIWEFSYESAKESYIRRSKAIQTLLS